jgi:hypothetical protein
MNLLAQKFFVYSLALLIAGLVVWWEISSWSECRETNSFWYCLRILGK